MNGTEWSLELKGWIGCPIQSILTKILDDDSEREL
jgi:hypothetical protein